MESMPWSGWNFVLGIEELKGRERERIDPGEVGERERSIKKGRERERESRTYRFLFTIPDGRRYLMLLLCVRTGLISSRGMEDQSNSIKVL